MKVGKEYQKYIETFRELTPEEIMERKIQQEDQKREILLVGAKLGATIAITLLLFGVIFGHAIVQGDSMYPNLKSWDLVLFFRLDHSYHPGDVVIIKTSATENIVKRVVAVAGDTVSIDSKTGSVYVNGEKQEEEEIFYPTYAEEGTEEIVVPEGKIYVLGDHRTNSEDSRIIGAVDTSQVLGKALSVFRIIGLET